MVKEAWVDVPIVSHHDCFIYTLSVQYLDDMFAHSFIAISVEISGFISVAVSEEVRRNNTISSFLQAGYLVAPVIRRRRISMKKEKADMVWSRRRHSNIAVSCAIGELDRFRQGGKCRRRHGSTIYYRRCDTENIGSIVGQTVSKLYIKNISSQG